MTADPFSKYRLNQLQDNKKINSSNDPENEDVFSKYRLSKPDSNEEDLSQYLRRNATRLGSRVAETIGGIPGDIADLIQSGVFSGLESLVGVPVTNEMREKAKTKFEKPASSSELKKISQEVTKGYTTPKNEKEKLSDEYAEILGSLLGPMKFRKALGVAALGLGAKKGTEILGAGEGTQEAAKLGTMIISSMINPKGVKQLYTNLYKQAEKLAPEGTLVSAKPLEKKLLSLKKDLEKGTLDRFESKVLEQTNRVLEKIKDGKVDVNHMLASQRSINGVAGDPEFFRRGEHLFPRLQHAVKNTIKLHKNPEFLKTWHSGNEAFGGLVQSQKLSKFIQRHLGNQPLKHAFIASIGEMAGGYPEAILPTLVGSGAAFAGVKGIELSQRIFANPTLRKYYGDVLRHAANENAPAMLKSAKLLDDMLKKQKD